MKNKVCPILKPNERTGLHRKCLEEDCAWYVDGSCAAVANAMRENNCRAMTEGCSKVKNDVLVTLAKYPEFREVVSLVVKGDAELKKTFAEFCHTCNEEDEEEIFSPSNSPSSSPSSEIDALKEELAATREYAKASDEAAAVAELENKKLKEEMERLKESKKQLLDDLDFAKGYWREANFKNDALETEVRELKEKNRVLTEEMKEVVADRDSIARENEGWQDANKTLLVKVEDLDEKNRVLVNEMKELSQDNENLSKSYFDIKEAYNDLIQMSENKREALEGEIELLKNSLDDTKQSEFKLKMKEMKMREDVKEGTKQIEIYDVNGEMWQCNPEMFPDLVAIRLQWDSELGWGNLEFTYNTKTHEWNLDSECMSEEFCLAVLKHWLHLVYTGEKIVQRVD